MQYLVHLLHEALCKLCTPSLSSMKRTGYISSNGDQFPRWKLVKILMQTMIATTAVLACLGDLCVKLMCWLSWCDLFVKLLIVFLQPQVIVVDTTSPHTETVFEGT